MTADANRALVETVYAAAGAGDWTAVRGYMADDLVIVEAASLPYAGRYTGPDALHVLHAVVSGYWSDFAIDFRGMTAGGDTVVCELLISGKSARTGDAFTMPLLELWRIRDGKVSEILPFYFDTARLAKIA